MTQHNHEMPPVRVAFILDNVVADVLHTDDRLAAIFLSNPLVIDISDREDANSITTNATYNPETQTFTPASPLTHSYPIMPEDAVDGSDEDGILLMTPVDPS